jgi:hypothetical protein
MHGGFAAALSRPTGLGKADPLVPASEQSIKDLHNFLLAAFAFAEQPQIPESARTFYILSLICSLL